MNKIRALSAVVAIALMSTAVFAQLTPAPPAPQVMQDVANRIVQLVNNRNADGLTAMTAEGAVYLDEDGHALPVTLWIRKVTGTQKQMVISEVHGKTLGNAGWVSFNYTMGETFRGQQITLKGTASIVLQQVGANWMIQLVHGALEQHVPGVSG